MSIELTFEERTSYLYARAVGIFNLREAKDCFRRIVEVAAQEKLLRVLFDARDLKGNMTTMDRYTLGDSLTKEILEKKNQVLPRIAIVGNEPFIDPQRFGETVARNRGSLLKVTTDIDQALQWLEA